MDDAAPSAEVTQAPAGTEAPAAEPKTPAKPRTIDDDLEDVLKKHGGLKFKSAGKEKSITAAKDLTRYLSRVDGTETAAAEALRVRSKAEDRDAKIAALEKMKPAERLKALEDLGIPARALREAVEEEILSSADREKELAQLTPRERELQQRLEAQQAELERHNQARQQWEARQAEEQQTAQAEQLYQKLSTVTATALQKAGITGEHAAQFLPAIAEEIDRKERLGLEYDETDLAETVLKQHAGLARAYYSSLPVEAHMEELRSVEMPDPKDPTRKTNRFELMLRAEAARRKAQLAGGAVPARAVPAAPKPPQERTAADAFEAARTFGGGAW